LANTLTSVMPDALVARFGGEEFTCLASIENEEEGEIILEKLRKSVESLTINHKGHEIKITISVGVSTAYGDSFDDMIKLADEAVFLAKEQGRNQVVFSGKGD